MWQYSVDKWNSEQHLYRLTEGSKCKLTVIRPCVTYGYTRIPYSISPQYQNVPAHSLVSGHPAKVVKNNIA